MDIHVYVHSSQESALLTEISNKLSKLLKKQETMSQELDDLTARVAANGDVQQSAITLLQGLKAALDAAGTDPAALKALSESLGAQDQALADAIVANTPAA